VEGDTQDADVTDASPKTDIVQPNLAVKSGGAGSNEIAYLTFDISGLAKTISDAKLTLHGASNGSPVTVGVYGTNNASWTDANLNWNDAPTLMGSAVNDQSVGAAGAYTWNITSLLQSAKTAGLKTITIAIKCESASKSGASFSGSRSPSSPPLMLVTSND
jgi:hypothetical protein